MTKIERRRAIVTLYQGNYESELADLMQQAMAALRSEETGQRRAGTKSKATALAQEYDAKLAEAEATAEKITVWAIGHNEWSSLADEHPPREGEADDKLRGVNMASFPKALLHASLADPATGGILLKQAKGQELIDELDPSRVHYVKLETAAWNVNVGDDALPKLSLVSLLQQQRDPDSKQQPDSE